MTEEVRRKRRLGRSSTIAASVALLASGAVAAYSQQSAPPAQQPAPGASHQLSGAPDTILFNGKISTMDRKGSTVQAIALRDGEVLSVGSNKAIQKMAGKRTVKVNLKGQRVLPGLIEGHIHGFRTGYHCWDQTVRLDDVTKRADVLKAYRTKAQRSAAGKWLWTTSGGWDVRQLDDPTPPTFAELTQAAPNNPVWVAGSSYTGARVNQAALDALDLEAGDAGVELDGSGQPTGVLTGAANTAVGDAIYGQLDTLGVDGEAKCYSNWIDEAVKAGLTSIHDGGGNTLPWRTTGSITEDMHGEEPVQKLYQDGDLKVRIAYHGMSNYEGAGRAIIDIRDNMGFIGDDDFRYLGPDEDTFSADPDYVDYLKLAAKRRLGVETHVGSTDSPLDKIIDGFEAANAENSIAGLGWIINHPGAGQPTDEQLARIKAMDAGVVLSFSRARNGNEGPRYRSVIESGVNSCISSDALNVAPWKPFQNLWYATTGQTMISGVEGIPADQRLTRMQALRAVTSNCAWVMGQQGNVGQLTPGSHADLIVLNKDYFKVSGSQIRTIESQLTIKGGDVVHGNGRFSYLNKG